MSWFKMAQDNVMYNSTGTLHVHGDGWVTIDVDPDLNRYYLSRFNRSRPATDIQIMPPKWGGHISIIRGTANEGYELTEEIQEYFDKINNKPISFRYSPTVLTKDNRHWQLIAESNEALDIREQIGLPREPLMPLHITIGVIKQL
jgi:hypothetical protein